MSQVPSAAHRGDVGKLTDERPKSSVHGKIPLPNHDSPLYVAATEQQVTALVHPPTKVSLLEVFVCPPVREMMLVSQQAFQVGTMVSSKWGSYRGESNRN